MELSCIRGRTTDGSAPHRYRQFSLIRRDPRFARKYVVTAIETAVLAEYI